MRGLYFGSFRKLKLSPGNSREVSVKILQSWVLCCGGIQFLTVSEGVGGKSFCRISVGQLTRKLSETLILGTPGN